MRRSATALIVLAAGLATLSAQPPTAASRIKALVGGTLIDGYAGPPIKNSVVLIDGDRISAVGQVGSLADSARRRGDLDGRHDRCCRACGTCTSTR